MVIAKVARVDPQSPLIAGGVPFLQCGHHIAADEAGPDPDSRHGHRENHERDQQAPRPAPASPEEKRPGQSPELPPDVTRELGCLVHRGFHHLTPNRHARESKTDRRVCFAPIPRKIS